MRFNLISDTSDGMGFAVRLKREDNAVRMWIRDQAAKTVGDGLVDKVGDLEDLLTGAKTEEDVFIFDGSGNGIVADHLRSQGFPVLGGSVTADRLERDRAFGLEAMQSAGIQVPRTETFHDFESAREYVKEHPERMVFKPSKALGEQACSHVAYDQEDLLEYIDQIAKENEMEHPEFDLQEFTPGVALSSEVWFDGTDFLPLFNHTLERKELMCGNLGPSGGCTGNIVWACDGCPICDEVRKMRDFLYQNKYVGPLDLNAIITEKGIYGLEWTPRFGYDATPTLVWGLLDGDLGGFFSDVARGQLSSRQPLREGFAGALRVTIPPWPTERHNAESGVPIRGLGDDYERYTYLYNVKASPGKPEKLCSAGAWGILLLFIDRGTSVARAFRKPAEFAEAVRIPDKQYRLDLVDQFKEDLAELQDVMMEA